MDETQDISLTGSVGEVPRNANRMGTEKKIIASRKASKVSKDMGVRPRSFYDDTDYEQMEEIRFTSSNLAAPPLAGYVQRWINMNKEKGSHLLRMLSQGGWKIRDPKTVPFTAGLNTGKWGEYEAIVAGNELILCCMRKEVHDKIQKRKNDDQVRKTYDVSGFGRDLYGATAGMKSQHANVYNPVVERN